MSIIEESRIVGVRFSLLSPQAVRKTSVVKVTSRDTYVNNVPVAGGLFDPRMGTLERGTFCPTDGLSYLDTPGYFGHIDLAKPVFYVHFMDTILAVLKIVCFKCKKLLIDKVKYKSWKSLSNDARWKRVYAASAKVKRCGEQNEDGCGCKVPKIKKEAFATILAEWTNDDGTKTLKVTPEVVIKIFSGISDEDVAFMGLDPVYSRPEWMVCQAFSVPPPSVRPSVKHDAQQRSEDDLTHILIQIVKINQSLSDKMNNPATPPHVIEDEHNILQYFVAILVDNNIAGAQPAAQRSSGRILKAVKGRLSGKTGRIRFNLMGKRVNHSARTVITPDPYISVQEVGVPKKIALNMTKPETVNSRNYEFMRKLVEAGPDVYPGAKIVEKNGAQIFLRYADRAAISQALDYGDVVHRCMLDGDYILFNRQPTLHRGSMMGHRVRIMPRGNTFRLNVAATKQYNADFDGDEMNLHMPQDSKSEIELRRLAAVPFQIVCPTTNTTNINIFQDSLLAAYQFSRKHNSFSGSQAMALFGNVRHITDYSVFSQERVGYEQLMTLILPPITVSCKGIHIVDGKFVRGQIDKRGLSVRSNSIIHRVCNDFGGVAATDFIDNFQHVLTEFMKVHGYSVGVSDLILPAETNVKINAIIQEKKKEVDVIIESTINGTFVNETGLTNAEVLEDKINKILALTNETAGKLGLNSLDPLENRFVQMVNAGSKGSAINIFQMVACLGQQQIDGQRIPYGLQGRTLPHFKKFDDSMKARGFVESAFINGLKPHEVFFHAQGGREGLIDTALRTAETGYIQRRLIKAMEDLKTCYDGTVRNSLGKIVQYKYGDDNIDPCRVEEQHFDLCWLTVEQVYDHYSTAGVAYQEAAAGRAQLQGEDFAKVCRSWIETMVEARERIVRAVFDYQNDSTVRLPIGFTYAIESVKNRFGLTESTKVDVTPLEVFQTLDHFYEELTNIGRNYVPSQLFKIAYYFFLSPAVLLKKHRFTRAALTFLMEFIVLQYKKAIIAPGEMVGVVAAQSIGEPITQLTLNTFHLAGAARDSIITHGTARVEEIMSISPYPKKPSMTIYPLVPTKDEANRIKSYIEQTKLADVTSVIELYLEESAGSVDESLTEYHRQFEEMVAQAGVVRVQPNLSKWIFRLEMDAEKMYNKGLTMNDIHFALKYTYGESLGVVFSDYNSSSLVFRIQLSTEFAKKKIKKVLDQSDYIGKIRQFEDDLLDLTIRGIDGIELAVVRHVKNKVVYEGGRYHRQDVYVIDTVGSRLKKVLGLPFVDVSRTTTNDIREVQDVLGVEAARNSIYAECTKAIEVDSYINTHNKTVLCDRMANTADLVSISRTGVNRDIGNPIGKASFEETTDMFIQAAKTGETDLVLGPSANVMLGQEGFYGTSSFSVILDLDQMKRVKPQRKRYAAEVRDDAKLADLSSLDVRNDLSVAEERVHALTDSDYTIDL